jgi:AcrR family transcriptional regulator
MTATDSIVSVAERLFGERGINAVSLREVAAAAGQRNNSAVTYHFGSRDGLVDAVFRHRMARIDERRRAMIVALDAAGRGNDLRALLEAVIYPLSEALGHEDGVSWYARFLRQVMLDPGFDVLAPARADVTRGLTTILGRLRPHLRAVPPGLRSDRIQLSFMLVIDALADHEARLAASLPTQPAPLLASHLVDAAAAVLTTPVSPETARELRLATRQGA